MAASSRTSTRADEARPQQSWNLAARMGCWSARHRKVAILGWLAFVAAAFVLGGLAGTNELTEADDGTGESGRAAQVYAAAGLSRGDAEAVLVESETMSVRTPAFRTAVADLMRRLQTTPGVEGLRSPYRAGNAGQISRDRHSALVQFEYHGAAIEKLLAAVEQVRRAHPGLFVGEFGDASAEKAVDHTAGKDLHRAEILSIPLTLAILLFTFGAIVAAGIPDLLALTAVIAAMGLLAFPSQLWPADDAADSVILLIGLAVGVDYSLFYIRREREERQAGKGPDAALEAAAATSGRAVLVSGMTVLVAMAGMFLAGNKAFTSVAVGAMLVVAIAVAGSLTVLPALLSKLGDRIEKGRIPYLGSRRRRAGEGRFVSALIDRVLRRPVVSAALSGCLLVVLAVPAVALKTNDAGLTALPETLEITKTYRRLQDAFPGEPAPAVVVVKAENVASPRIVSALRELRERALATGLMRAPMHTRVNAEGTVAALAIPLDGTGTNARSEHALTVVRKQLIPATIGGLDGVEVNVGGLTASSKDFNDLMKAPMPIVFAFVLGLAFLLLLAVFRSIVVAAKAIILNLLSVGAAYGLLVAVFQWGWGESLLGFQSTGGITAWLPLFMFVVLFGLSMDYHVFILTRIREAYDRGLSNGDAVEHGIKTTAGVVTSAGAVMVAVFAVFATLEQIELKQLGVGLAAAILIDATVVRAVLLPATMKLLGRWNWYLPRWLEWLPRVSPESADAAGAPRASRQCAPVAVRP